MYHNQVKLSLTPVQRLGNQACNRTKDYWVLQLIQQRQNRSIVFNSIDKQLLRLTKDGFREGFRTPPTVAGNSSFFLNYPHLGDQTK